MTDETRQLQGSPAGRPGLAEVAVFHGETSLFIVLAGLARKKITLEL
jgi:hypothetical protein